MKNIKAIAKKEFLHIIRDRRTLAMIVLMPLVQLLIYGYAISTDIKHLALYVYDEDQKYLSRRLIDTFEQSAYFDIKKRVSSADELYQALDRGKAKAGVLIPPNFTKDLLAGRGPKLQLLIDGTDSNPATVALNTSQAIVTAFMQREGLVPVSVAPIDFRPRLWYNPDLKSSFFMVPGLIGLLLQMLIPMITASAIVREKERGNIEQLIVTPIKPFELILGKIIPYIAIGLLITVTIVVTSGILFHIPVRGNPFTLLVLTFLFIVVCLGIGLLASTLADNQQQATQVIMFFMPPSILLSGFIFPRETMPLFVYYLSYAIPLTYFVKIIRGIILKGLGFAGLWDQILPLVLMAAIVLILSVKRFHKRLA
ncbi:MAG TPA: ABC transporter permease [Candidatus Omnitrophota bacterium]|nr:ABC transporter permease [Candidatus Omnitrophota bacterium]HPD84388.1 ABC transporter permease [Candidatus Omnitrophota bacterium]HRZ03246.1 ABC transporter permease [Candidatus Omnitrophota bacterium]